MARRELLLAVALVLPFSAAPSRAEQQAKPPSCRADNLVPWNCAALYSGSFEWKSVVSGGSASQQINIKEDVAVGITAGVATCVGTRTGYRKSATGETQLIFTITGPGLVAVEYGTNTSDAPKGPYYRVTVACPSLGGEEIHTDFITGQKTVLKRTSVPPRGFDGEEVSSYKQSGSQKDAVLQGSTVDEHPEADAANGLSGTITATWNLVKR
jgi:hypothetical protein